MHDDIRDSYDQVPYEALPFAEAFLYVEPVYLKAASGESYPLLQRVLSNDVSKIGLTEQTGVVQGGAQYSVICSEGGGVLDDVFTYRLDADRYLTVTNAANHASVFAAEPAFGLLGSEVSVSSAVPVLPATSTPGI